ncbi:XdhC family protein [Mucilaginibacter sp. 14171R-50]|uniref:XdhC family protein n=1 Tax=Mucilaginibacter sp. 14171R-50 TaxID=2703789 RepID=UPI001EE4D962|nr:XdhC/CoxI family protein [Mucilaginibacter sp. 14171R-50]
MANKWLQKLIFEERYLVKELEDIVQAFDAAQNAGRQSALATVVHVEGSSYRRAGARMLITDDGQLTGAISGGCLEGDALRKARLAMARQTPMLVTYDTTDDDDAKFGVGLGCNGIIHILIEPVNVVSPNNPITYFRQFLSERKPVVLITVFALNDKQAAQPGTCALMTEDGKVTGAFPDGIIEDVILTDAADVLKKGNSVTKTYIYASRFTCFIELLQPAVSLVIVGAGNDAIPLTQLAGVLGWQITVIDGRANYVVVDRFPRAHTLIVSRPDQALAKLHLDNRTVFVLMTHNYNYDREMLKQLLPLQLSYIGTLGPKKRLIRMIEELQQDGLDITPHQLNSVYGPAGLDIGSENAEEIALSIIAEIQAVLMRRNGLSLRYKTSARSTQNLQMVQSPLPTDA